MTDKLLEKAIEDILVEQELLQKILKSPLHNDDKIRLITPFIFNQPMGRDVGFKIVTQPRAIDFKQQIQKLRGFK